MRHISSSESSWLKRHRSPFSSSELSLSELELESSDAPTAKAGQRRKRKSKVHEGSDSNEASYVVKSNANEEVVTSAMQITTTMPHVPNDEAAQMNSLPIQEEFPRSNVETVANPIQIEVIDHELLQENRESFLDEVPILTTELFRVKQWTNDIAEALLLSTIAQAYPNKVLAKLAGSKGKLPVMEDNLQALSFVDFEEIDQANLHEGIQRSLLEFQHHPGATSSAQPESAPMQGECQINEGELVDVCVHNKQVIVPESSNMQVLETFASHIDELTHEDMLEKPVMIPAEVEVEELATDLATVPVEVEELATDLATVPVEVQEQAEATVLATISTEGTVQVEEQATVLATVDNPLEVKYNLETSETSELENDDALNMEVPTEEERQMQLITDLHNELSTLRSENTATFAKVDNIEAKVTKIDGNAELLVDYAKKGEESSHLALSPSFAPIGSTTGPKFGVIDYFREGQPKYTLNDAPPLIKKRPKKDQVASVANQNSRLEEELKKASRSPNKENVLFV
nr:hypothetical protein Iba_chr05cCG9550 [Ipomoea batatas]